MTRDGAIHSPLEAPGEPVTPAPPTNGFSSETARRAARNATALIINAVAANGLLFVWQLVLARWLGKDLYGVYGTVGGFLAIGASIPEFGMGLIVLRDVARRPQDAGRYLAATLAMQPLLAIVGWLLLTGAAVVAGYDTQIQSLLALAAASLLVNTLGNMCYNQLLALERMVITAAISIAHIALLVALAAGVLAAGGGLWGLYAVTLIAGLLRAAALWAVLLRLGVRPQFPVERAIAWGLIINGAPIAANSFLALAFQHSDKLLTTRIIGTEATGQLTAGFIVVFGVIELLSTTVLLAVFPLMSRTYGEGNRAMFDLMLEKLSFFNLMLSTPIAIYTTLLAVPLSALVFGAEFTRTADVLQVLIWYTVVTMVGNVFAKALLIENRQRLILYIRSGGLVLNIALNIVLLQTVGVVGTAIATLVAEIAILVVMLASFTFPADWWARMANHVWRLALVALSVAGVVFVLQLVHPLLAAVVGLPLYAGLVLVSGALAPDDWDLIYRLVTAMPGGSLIGHYWQRDLGATPAGG